jgi:uncharacterized membrane protein
MENELKAGIVLILVSLAVGAYAFTLLPEQVASHWGLSGEADGYMSKAVGAFLMPGILAVMFAVLIIVPRIDPLKANIETFKKDYHQFVLVVMSFLFLVYLQTILWNLGTEISFNLTMPVLLGFLFVYLGVLLDKAKRNYFIGIRTPWTLSSDVVWDKTHKLGAKVFKAIGIVSIISVLLPAYAILAVIGLIVAAAVGLMVYSYLVYTDVMRAGKGIIKKDDRKAKRVLEKG